MGEPSGIVECDCGRCIEARGRSRRIEDAFDGDGRQLAYDYLRSLENAKNKKKRQRYADLAHRFKVYSLTGYLEVPREMRKITDLVSEIKTAEDRILFYETAQCATRSAFTTRLTHGFEKRIGKTREGKIPGGQIRRAEWVRKSDIEKVTDERGWE